VGAAGSLDGATSTTNSAYAAVIPGALAGSWTAQDQKTLGTSFGYFNPTVDNTANIPLNGQVASDLYEFATDERRPNVAGTLLGELVLTQNGLSFDVVPEPSTWVLVGFGLWSLGHAPPAKEDRSSLIDESEFTRLNSSAELLYPHIRARGSLTLNGSRWS